MDIIYDELKKNNVDFDKDTLSYYLKHCLEEHRVLFNDISDQISGDNLPSNLSVIYEEMNVDSFGRIIAYLTLVHKVNESLDEESIREVVRRTIDDFMRKYKRNNSSSWLLRFLLLSVMFAYLSSVHVQETKEKLIRGNYED